MALHHCWRGMAEHVGSMHPSSSGRGVDLNDDLRSAHRRGQAIACCVLDSASLATSFQRTACHHCHSVHGSKRLYRPRLHQDRNQPLWHSLATASLAASFQRTACHHSHSVHGRGQAVMCCCLATSLATNFQRTACCHSRSVHARDQAVRCCVLATTSLATRFQRTAHRQSQSVHGREQPVACCFLVTTNA